MELISQADKIHGLPPLEYVKEHGRWVSKLNKYQLLVKPQTLGLIINARGTMMIEFYIDKTNPRSDRLSVTINAETGGIIAIRGYRYETCETFDLDEFKVGIFYEHAGMFQLADPEISVETTQEL